MKNDIKIIIGIGIFLSLILSNAYNLFAMDISMAETDEYVQARFADLTLEEKIAQAKAPVHHSMLMKYLHSIAPEGFPEEKRTFEQPGFHQEPHSFIDYAYEAQNELGIPQDQQVPILMTKLENQLKDAIAATDSHIIIGNTHHPLINNIESTRFTTFHEGTHVKHFDYTSLWIFYKIFDSSYMRPLAFSFLSAYLLLLINIKAKQQMPKTKIGNFMTKGSLVLLSGASLSTIMLGILPIGKDQFFSRLYYNYEQRADLTAAYACECHFCVSAKAQTREGFDDDLSIRGYLSAPKLHVIAQELKAANKVCKYHQEATNNNQAAQATQAIENVD